MVRPPQAATGQFDATRGFVERALRDFGLMEAFEERPPEERAACLLWIAASTDSHEEEDRVSRMLDALAGGGPLVPRQATLRRSRARASRAGRVGRPHPRGAGTLGDKPGLENVAL